MWDSSNYYIKFVPEANFTDPSYHLPHFYELFAERGLSGRQRVLEKAAEASREYLHLCCHPVTGMAPEYRNMMGLLSDCLETHNFIPMLIALP